MHRIAIANRWRVLVSYDIGDHRARRRAVKLLKRHGVRVLESVFECEASPDRLAGLQRSLQRLLTGPTDGVRIYRLCAQCAEPVAVLGHAVEPSIQETIVV